MDLTNHAVSVPLAELATGASRVGIETSGMVVSVREDSGFIMRCTECRRVLRDGACYDHGANDGEQDIRLRLVVDDAGATTAVLTNKEASLASLEMTEDGMQASVEEHGDLGFVQLVRERLLGRNVAITGRTIVDEQGAMILADGLSLVEQDAQLRATELRALWGWA